MLQYKLDRVCDFAENILRLRKYQQDGISAQILMPGKNWFDIGVEYDDKVIIMTAIKEKDFIADGGERNILYIAMKKHIGYIIDEIMSEKFLSTEKTHLCYMDAFNTLITLTISQSHDYEEESDNDDEESDNNDEKSDNNNEKSDNDNTDYEKRAIKLFECNTKYNKNYKFDEDLLLNIMDQDIGWKITKLLLVMIKSNIFDLTRTTPHGSNVLLLACYRGLTEVALEILKHKCNPGQFNKNGNTALIWACSNGMSGVAKVLLENEECLPNFVNTEGMTALDYAKWNNMSEIVEILKKYQNLTSIPKIIQKENKKEIPLVQKSSRVRSIEKIMTENELDNKVIENVYKNSIDLAIKENNEEEAIQIFELNKRFDTKFKLDNIVLSNLMRSNINMEKLIITLIQSGDYTEDIITDIYLECFRIAMKLESDSSAIKIIELFRKLGKKYKLDNYWKCKNNILDIREKHERPILMLVQNGEFNKEELDKNGNTLLIWACKKNCKNVVMELLKYPCNLGAANIVGETALIWACYNGNEEIAMELLKTGDCNHTQTERGDRNMNALYYAKTKKLYKVIDFITDLDNKKELNKCPDEMLKEKLIELLKKIETTKKN